MVNDDLKTGNTTIRELKLNKEDKNYIYTKGRYVCRKCFYKRK